MSKQIITLSILFLFCFFQINAQSPNQINYQGVARNNSGNPLSNQNISIRLSIHDANASGIVQYSETRNVTTDATGLFNIQIGSLGTVNTTGSWSSITWDNGAKYLQVEMDINGGTNFINMGTQQLVSVPYAQYANKAGGLTPSATITPSQLTSGGASVNDVLQFDGTNWVPTTQSSGTLALPYNVTDPNLVSFAITNTSSLGGSAIYGKTTTNNFNASGIRGESNGTYGNGVLGKANGNYSYGVLGQNTTGIGVKGYATGASSIGVYGESNGASGTGIYGFSNSTGIGVLGQSGFGPGVKGYSYGAGSAAILGESDYGAGVKASSTYGYALETNGAVKIAGGNTNPSSGAVLTSDATGNAVWKNNKISFAVRNAINSSIPNNTETKVEFANEDHDLQNNFINYAGSITANSSKFTAPKAGVYNFSAWMMLAMYSSTNNFEYASLNLIKNGVVYARYSGQPYNKLTTSDVELSLNVTLHLNVNDKIWLEVNQNNESDTPQSFLNSNDYGRFSGYLLFAD